MPGATLDQAQLVHPLQQNIDVLLIVEVRRRYPDPDAAQNHARVDVPFLRMAVAIAPGSRPGPSRSRPAQRNDRKAPASRARVGAAKHGFFEIGVQPGDVVQHVVPTQRFEPIQRRIESG